MAHADYHCCAICDSKLEYSENSRTKETICVECLRSLHQLEVSVYTPDEFIEWARQSDKGALKAVLLQSGYAACCYGNSFDEEIARLTEDQSK